MLFSLNMYSYEKHNLNLKKTKVIEIDNSNYIFEFDYSSACVKFKGNVIFKDYAEKDEYIVDLGYSQLERKFYTLKIRYYNDIYNVILNLDNKRIVSENIYYMIYSPKMIEYDKRNYILFLNQYNQLEIRDLSLKLIKRLSFNTVMNEFKVIKENNVLYIKFKSYYKRRINKLKIRFKDLLMNENPDFDVLFDKKEISPIMKRYFSNDLNYYNFLCFGDSITYGYINHQPMPELGYVPRLEIMFDADVYDGNFINEGYPGTTTYQALEFYKEVFQKHLPKYILYHYGTNDLVFLELTVAGTLNNIENMVKFYLENGSVPVLSTLIPRSGFFGTGVFRARAIAICEGIKEIVKRYDLFYVDFWEIFSNYPEEDGGYASLMSDITHPSEKGYKLMAENWLSVLKTLPPDKPEIISSNLILRNNKIGLNLILKQPKEPNFKSFYLYEIMNDKEYFLMEFTSNNIELFLPSGKEYKLIIKSLDGLNNISDNSDIIKYFPYTIY